MEKSLAEVLQSFGPPSKDERLSLVDRCINRMNHVPSRYLTTTTLFLGCNLLTSLRGLEQFTHLQSLSVASNAIGTIDALTPLASLPKLHTLFLEGNPVVALPFYRRHVLMLCPCLETLDGKKVTSVSRKKASVAVHHESMLLSRIRVSVATIVHTSSAADRLAIRGALARKLGGRSQRFDEGVFRRILSAVIADAVPTGTDTAELCDTRCRGSCAHLPFDADAVRWDVCRVQGAAKKALHGVPSTVTLLAVATAQLWSYDGEKSNIDTLDIGGLGGADAAASRAYAKVLQFQAEEGISVVRRLDHHIDAMRGNVGFIPGGRELAPQATSSASIQHIVAGDEAQPARPSARLGGATSNQSLKRRGAGPSKASIHDSPANISRIATAIAGIVGGDIRDAPYTSRASVPTPSTAPVTSPLTYAALHSQRSAQPLASGRSLVESPALASTLPSGPSRPASRQCSVDTTVIARRNAARRYSHSEAQGENWRAHLRIGSVLHQPADLSGIASSVSQHSLEGTKKVRPRTRRRSTDIPERPPWSKSTRVAAAPLPPSPPHCHHSCRAHNHSKSWVVVSPLVRPGQLSVSELPSGIASVGSQNGYDHDIPSERPSRIERAFGERDVVSPVDGGDQLGAAPGTIVPSSEPVSPPIDPVRRCVASPQRVLAPPPSVPRIFLKRREGTQRIFKRGEEARNSLSSSSHQVRAALRSMAVLSESERQVPANATPVGSAFTPSKRSMPPIPPARAPLFSPDTGLPLNALAQMQRSRLPRRTAPRRKCGTPSSTGERTPRSPSSTSMSTAVRITTSLSRSDDVDSDAVVRVRAPSPLTSTCSPLRVATSTLDADVSGFRGTGTTSFGSPRRRYNSTTSKTPPRHSSPQHRELAAISGDERHPIVGGPSRSIEGARLCLQECHPSSISGDGCVSPCPIPEQSPPLPQRTPDRQSTAPSARSTPTRTDFTPRSRALAANYLNEWASYTREALLARIAKNYHGASPSASVDRSDTAKSLTLTAASDRDMLHFCFTHWVRKWREIRVLDLAEATHLTSLMRRCLHNWRRALNYRIMEILADDFRMRAIFRNAFSRWRVQLQRFLSLSAAEGTHGNPAYGKVVPSLPNKVSRPSKTSVRGVDTAVSPFETNRNGSTTVSVGVQGLVEMCDASVSASEVSRADEEPSAMSVDDGVWRDLYQQERRRAEDLMAERINLEVELRSMQSRRTNATIAATAAEQAQADELARLTEAARQSHRHAYMRIHGSGVASLSKQVDNLRRRCEATEARDAEFKALLDSKLASIREVSRYLHLAPSERT